MQYERTPGAIAAHILFILILTAVAAACLYPVIYVLSMSISDALLVMKKDIILLPKQISFDAYRMVFAQKNIWTAYYNTLWNVVVGTSINIVLTVLTAYPLSRRQLVIKKQIVFFFAFTMWFYGGMIPTFLVVKTVGLYASRWAMVLPTALSVWNLIITRTFFAQTIPEEIVESGKIDGASDFRVLLSLVLPISQAILAVNALFYAVGHWNAFFNAILYLPDVKLQPIQVLLRNLLMTDLKMSGSSQEVVQQLLQEKMKYAVIAFAVLPVTVLYPFLQRYFVQGVMLGSLKE